MAKESNPRKSNRTTDHKRIREWAEQRDAKPSVVTREGEDTSILRLDMPGYAEENLKEISWDEWFEIFEDNSLALLYSEETKEGERSNFNKLVNRDS